MVKATKLVGRVVVSVLTAMQTLANLPHVDKMMVKGTELVERVVVSVLTAMQALA